VRRNHCLVLVVPLLTPSFLSKQRFGMRARC
jgi:hypothetical protein